VRTPTEIRRCAVHEAAHAVLGVVLMRGIIFADIKEIEKTGGWKTGGWTQFVDFENVNTPDGLLPYVVCLFAGYAAQRLLLGLPHASMDVCKLDLELIEKAIEPLSEDDRRAIRWSGILEACVCVNRYRAAILELAEELLRLGRISGDQAAEIVERNR
jgi:hypothetical protein